MPIVGGGRLTGKIGAFDVGALNIQTDDEVLADAEMTNFTVVRLKRDILRRSSLGAIFTNRSLSLAGDGSSQSYGRRRDVLLLRERQPAGVHGPDPGSGSPRGGGTT